jgi:copper(I)-binding protein
MKIATTVKRSLAFTTLTLAALVLAGCTATDSASTEATAAADAAVVPTASDVWIKAVPELMEGMAMTGLFGVFENPTDEDIMILGGTADSALTLSALDAHEVVQNDAGEMIMQDAEGGIVIPANGSVTLKPGGYHVMFWDLLKPIAVGDDVVVTINFSNGTSMEVTAVAREIANANETYDPNSEVDMDHDHSEMDHDHSDMDME